MMKLTLLLMLLAESNLLAAFPSSFTRGVRVQIEYKTSSTGVMVGSCFDPQTHRPIKPKSVDIKLHPDPSAPPNVTFYSGSEDTVINCVGLEMKVQLRIEASPEKSTLYVEELGANRTLLGSLATPTLNEQSASIIRIRGLTRLDTSGRFLGITPILTISY